MSEENRTPTRLLVEAGDVHKSGESTGEGEDNLQSQLLNRRMSSSEVDRRTNGTVVLLATQFEMLVVCIKSLDAKRRGRSKNQVKN